MKSSYFGPSKILKGIMPMRRAGIAQSMDWSAFPLREIPHFITDIVVVMTGRFLGGV